jgi:hypothetical protein
MKNYNITPMKKLLLITGIAVLFIIAMQFKSSPVVNPPATTEIHLPDDVRAIVERACYDCHSNHTKTAWFDKIPPASALVARHVTEARSRLNFSEWDKNPPAVQQLLLWEVVNVIEQDKMPLHNYLLLHPGAAISAEELSVLKRYVNTLPGRHKVDTAKIIRKDIASSPTTNSKAPAVPVSLNGIPYSADYKTWKVISVTDKYDGGSMRVVYGNDIMVKAIKEHTLPFPDGARIVKAVWGKQREDQDGNVLPANFQNVQIMIKDSKKYKSTEGWGFAKFDGLDLKPFGKTAAFANTCINCHRTLVSESDFVFNIPTK